MGQAWCRLVHDGEREVGINIVITIVDIRGDKVRLGIEAPQHVPVHRQEVYEAIQRENRKAAQPQGQQSPLAE